MDGYCLAQLLEEEPAQRSGLMLSAPAGRRNDVAIIGSRFDDTDCWVCGAAIIAMHCKIVCNHCGFMRDCSDP
jgi:hypothetical protein